MIEIAKPYIQQYEEKCRLCCDIKKEQKVHNIWFEFDLEYEQYICTERIDGILINILLFCMEHGYDIKSDTCISEKLYYQITNMLIPSLARNIENYKTIQIEAPLDSSVICGEKAVGTGLSGGVDSFYTILNNIDKDTKSFNITHLTFFNAGASGSYGGESARNLFKERAEEMKVVAEELKLPLIMVDTNINEFICQDHEQTHTFRSLAIPMLLQKLFGVYYYSAGVEFSDFRFDIMDTAFCDLLNCACLSNENITFYSIGGETNRIGKVEYISDFPIVQRRLNICIKDSTNCGQCSKCKRTLMDLYAIKKLDNFEKVFDLELFKRNKNKYIAEVLCSRKTNFFSREIYEKMKENKIKIPVSSKTYYLGYMSMINLVKKVYRTIKNCLK